MVSVDLHAAFVEAVTEVRERFAKADIGHFDLTINADGRTMTDCDEVKIEYRLEAGYGCSVKGNALDVVITECLRRNGWDERHAPKALPKPTVKSRY